MDLNSESEQMSSEEEVRKEKKSKKKSSKKSKHKKSKKKSSKKSKHRSSGSESESADEWVEKKIEEKTDKMQQPERDDWMTSSNNFLLPTFSKEQQKPKEKDDKNYEKYDPKSSTRELNPYWKTGEGGLPSFQKPKDNDDDNDYFSKPSKSSGNWRKSTHSEPRKRSRSKSPSPLLETIERSFKPQSNPESSTASHSDFLTDAQMNDIGAKMIKAEIMGNTTRYEELKDKLEKAKTFKKSGKAGPQSSSNEGVLLTLTNPSTGTSRPISQRDDQKKNPQDRRNNKKKRAETHLDGERTKYYADDDKYDIKQMVRHSSYSLIKFSELISFFSFSLNARNFLMELIRILNLPRQLLKLKTMTKWIWQISFQTLYEKMQNKRTNGVKPLENIIEWKKCWIRVINALNHLR